MLVVDAATGGFEAGIAAPSGARGGGGQTREHAQVRCAPMRRVTPAGGTLRRRGCIVQRYGYGGVQCH